MRQLFGLLFIMGAVMLMKLIRENWDLIVTVFTWGFGIWIVFSLYM